MRYLIVNADDLGLSKAINEGIKRCYMDGVITGVSVMSCGKAFEHACEMLEEMGKDEVGAHLSLTGNLVQCSKKDEVKTLLDEDGFFVKDYGALVSNYYRKKIDFKEIQTEWAKQIEKVQSADLEITHLDSHEHVHMLPEVLKVLIALAKEYEIPYIRLPLEEFIIVKKQFKVRDFLRYRALKMFAKKAKALIRKEDVLSNNLFLGHFHAGRINDKVLCYMLEHLRHGINELVIHPAVKSEELNKISPWHRGAYRELYSVMNGKWKKLLNNESIYLISHKEAIEIMSDKKS